jgi:hypothetical protein
MDVQTARTGRYGSETPAPAGAVRVAGGRQRSRVVDVVEEWGHQSFPASDPPANW